MMRTYRNTRTGAVISTLCEINGGDWEEVAAASTAGAKKPKSGKGKKAEKNKAPNPAPDDETPEPDDETPEEE